MGEVQSKCEHIADTPLMPDVATEMYQLFLAKGVNATTAIEGNTLSIEEVQKRIRHELELPPSKEYLGIEIDNIVHACNQIKDAVLAGEKTELIPDQVKKFNAMVLNNLPLQESVVPGQIRDYPVIVGSYRGAPAQDCEYLLKKLCDWINGDWGFPGEHKVAMGCIKAIMAHLYLAWIHPFGDGNGRTARMLEFQILFSLGIPAAATHLLSNHYNQTRAEYYRHLEKASRETDGVYAFIEYALQGFVDGLREQIKWIKMQQLQVHWINYIHDYFRDKKGVSSDRQKHLLIDLSLLNDFVPLDKIQLISRRVMEAYKNKSEKTLSRDIKQLEEEGLVVIYLGRVRAKSERILAFRSPAIKTGA
jgi:Fic family protein